MSDFDKDLWNTISEYYDKAQECLWGSQNSKNWRIDEETGMYHLWNAYYLATTTPIKNYLLLARIIMMMYNRTRWNMHNYDAFHKYIEPAMMAYEYAEKNEEKKPTKKELELIKLWYDSSKYELSKTENTEEQINSAYKLIDGLNDVNDFGFHDSKNIFFEHTENNAKLKLKYDSVAITLEFSEVYDIYVEVDPTCDWINDFYCYRTFHDKKKICFDIGFYKIICRDIAVIEVDREDA